MIHGHIVRHSRKEAWLDKSEFPEKVWCPECLHMENVKIEDYGFGDDFGGVSDWRAVAECGHDPEDCISGCSGCGDRADTFHQVMYNRADPKKKNWTDDWFCPACYETYKNELEGR